MVSLSIFANFYINSEERLQRMQDSFRSFCETDIENWVINIRGPYRSQAGEFLRKNLGAKLKLFELESKKGWFYDSRRMLSEINSDYVLFWIEDHVNINKSPSIINNIVLELKENNVDSLWYSAYSYKIAYRDINRVGSKNIEWFDLDLNNFDKVLAVVPEHYIVSCVSIVKCSLFKKIINTDDKKIAKKWPKETPFEFEKSHKDLHWLPMRCAVLKEELFVSIDDDFEHPGSCLISRGLYPNRLPREHVGIAGGCTSITKKSSILLRGFNKFKRLINQI